MGTVVGAFNGFCISMFKVSPFIVTLGTMNITHGITLILSQGGCSDLRSSKAVYEYFWSWQVLGFTSTGYYYHSYSSACIFPALHALDVTFMPLAEILMRLW